MPADSSRAVFLSYASQDAEAARRICESLRSGGVEVWFDADGGLEHGDEWDAKIRRQIKECVLFIPVISANTQARHEGYFRIEWDLAAERARGIASGVPFILPVVIDDTREPDALVPDRFRAVQWTRLRGGDVPADVQQRFLKLWSHRTGVLKHESQEVARAFQPVRSDDTGAKARATPAVGRRVPAAAWIAAAALALLAGGYFFAKRPSESPAPSGQNAGTGTRPLTTEKPAAPLSEARKLVLQARALIDDDWLAGRENFRLADELCERATKLDPIDGEAWATRARVSALLIDRNYDVSSQRRDTARSHAERAMQLAPESIEAGLAMALVLAQNGSAPDAIQRMRDLLGRAPMDARVARSLAATLSPPGKPANAEATDIRLHHPSFGGRDPRPLLDEARTMHDTSRRLAECEELMARASALGPCWESYAMDLAYHIYSVVDLDTAAKVAEHIPARLLQEDVFAVLVAHLWIFRGDGAKALAALARVPRDFVEDRWFFGPKATLMAAAYRVSGRTAAAEEQYKQALTIVDKRLLAESGDSRLHAVKAEVLARLGRKDEALKTQRLALELGRRGVASYSEAKFHLANGDREEAILRLRRTLFPVREDRLTSVNLVRLDPEFAAIRSDPRVAEMITGAEAMIAKLRRKPDASTARSPAVAPVASTGPDPRSVAVLAFANLSDDRANEYFSDGIADELLTVLQKIPGLRVAARTSAFSFKGKNATAREVGEQLGMAHVVEGSVQKSGKRVKITARLSRAATNEEIWSESFGPLELTDVFATQSEIAQAIVAKLRGQLTGETATTPAATALQAEIKAQVQAATKGGTKNPEAHQLYLQGRFLATRSGSADVARGIGCYERALQLDPDFALAWAALARARLWQVSWEPLNPARAQEARTAAARALALDPDVADAHSVLSQILLRHAYEWRAARETSARALALAPENAAVITDAAATEQALGSLEKSIALARRAVALDPVSVDTRFYLAMSYLFLGRLAEAEGETRRMIELSPNGIFSHGLLSSIHLMQGRPADALAAALKEPEKMYRLQNLAAAHFALGQIRESDAALQEMIRDFKDVGPYPIAWACTMRGDRDKAFEWLERSYELRDSGISWIRGDTLLKPLHSDPRWPAFLKKIGLTDEQLK